MKPQAAEYVPMIPGPVSLHPRILAGQPGLYGLYQVEEEVLPLYDSLSRKIAGIMGTRNSVVLMTGEGMIALWGAMKSCLSPGDPVVSVGTGVFGDGIGDMAAQIGCRVERVSLPYDSTIGNGDSLQRIEEAVKRVRPVMITAVHCETPSGTLNPLAELAEIKKRYEVPLLYVDAVASLGGVPVLTDEWSIDLLLGGSQKCLAAPADMAMIAVSEAAWARAESVGYAGYDALLPFRNALEQKLLPYTPHWHGLKALDLAADALLEEGLEAVFTRHERVAEECRQGLGQLGIGLFPNAGAVASATVTAALIPEGFSWSQWQLALRDKGLLVGGSFGPMAGKVFRLGHMGTQADSQLLGIALRIIAEVRG